MAYLRQWMLGIVACALLVSLGEQLAGGGVMRKTVRFAGGLLLMLSILQPVVQIDLDAPELDLDTYRETLAEVQLALTDARDAALSDGIAARTGAYIEDKAAQMGLTVRAEVQTENVNGVFLPAAVTLYGSESEELAAYIETQLGIAKEKLVWKEAG